MDRLFRSGPTLLLCAAVAILAYCQFGVQETVPDRGNTLEWSQAVSQRIVAMEQRLNQPAPLPIAALPAPVAVLQTSIEDRVLDLPEDGQNWATIVVYGQDAASQRLRSNFEYEPQLVALKQQTNYYELPPTHYWVRQHLPGASFPLVLVQRPTTATEAKVIYKATGQNVPLSGSVLAGEIAQAIEDCRPRPTPAPTPTPNPAPVQPQPIPDLRPPAIQPSPQDDNLGLLSYLAIAGAALGGAFFAAKREG